MDSIFQFVAKQWKPMHDDLKKAWNNRAARFNSIKKNGRFQEIPAPILENLHMLVKECIALDWARLKKTLKRSITNPPGQDLGEAEFDMPDHFVLLSQSYRRYQLGHLIQTIAFGEDFSLLEETEIITKSKNVTFVHIASGRRFEDLLQVQGDVASQYVDEEKDLFFRP